MVTIFNSTWDRFNFSHRSTVPRNCFLLKSMRVYLWQLSNLAFSVTVKPVSCQNEHHFCSKVNQNLWLSYCIKKRCCDIIWKLQEMSKFQSQVYFMVGAFWLMTIFALHSCGTTSVAHLITQGEQMSTWNKPAW